MPFCSSLQRLNPLDCCQVWRFGPEGVGFMRWFWCVMLLVMSVDIRAAAVLLIPESNPKPVYPAALARAGITGDVRVSFVANADGSVSKVRIVQSDHPELAEASKAAVEQWRFKPWRVEGEALAEQHIVAPMTFRLEAPDGVYPWLKELRCREVNQSLVGTPAAHWVDLPVFHYTRGYLSNGFFQVQMSSEERLAMIAKLNSHVPSIARRCLNHPVARFHRLLPADIRALF